jgi:hypothetical protein
VEVVEHFKMVMVEVVVEQVDFELVIISVCGATPYSITVGAGGAGKGSTYVPGGMGTHLLLQQSHQQVVEVEELVIVLHQLM